MAFRNDLLFSSLIDPSLYEMRNIIEIAKKKVRTDIAVVRL